MGRGNLNLCVHIPTHVTLLFEGGGGIISLGDLWGGDGVYRPQRMDNLKQIFPILLSFF